jgi:hypothetical protein
MLRILFYQSRKRLHHGGDGRWFDAFGQSEQLEASHSSNSSSQAVFLYIARMLSLFFFTVYFRSTTCVAVSGGMICSASLDRTVAVISIDYEVWFSQGQCCAFNLSCSVSLWCAVMFIVRILAAVCVVVMLRWFDII